MGLGGVNLMNRMPTTQGVETGSNVTGTTMTGVNTTGPMQSARLAGPIDADAVNKMREQLLKFACNTLGVTGFDALPQSVKDALNAGVTEGQGDVLPLEKRMFLVMNAVDENKMMISPQKDLRIPENMLGDIKRLNGDDSNVEVISFLKDGDKHTLQSQAFKDASAAVCKALNKGATGPDLIRKLSDYYKQLGIAMEAVLDKRTEEEVASAHIPSEYLCAKEVQTEVLNLIKQIKYLGSGANKSVGPKETPNASASQDPSATRKSSAAKKSMQEMSSPYQQLSNNIDTLLRHLPVLKTDLHLRLAELGVNVTTGLDGNDPHADVNLKNCQEFANALDEVVIFAKNENRKLDIEFAKLYSQVQTELRNIKND